MFKRLRTAFLEALTQIWLSVLAILGIAVIAASILLTWLYVEPKGLIIITVSVGCSIGMAMLCKAYFKLLEIHQSKNIKERLDRETLKQQLNTQEKENEKLLLEKERLERMRINVTSIAPILKLGLVSIHVNLHDFMQKTHRDEFVREGVIFKDDVVYQEEYIGVLNKRFNVQLGIDLKKLRFLLSGDQIIVSGISSEFQGFMNEHTHWLLRELRQKKIVDGELEHYMINNHDVRIQHSMIEQENSFKERINLGLEFKNLDTVILEMAKQFICLILSPLNKQIIFVVDTRGGTTLEDFINQQNKRLDTMLRNLEDGVMN